METKKFFVSDGKKRKFADLCYVVHYRQKFLGNNGEDKNSKITPNAVLKILFNKQKMNLSHPFEARK